MQNYRTCITVQVFSVSIFFVRHYLISPIKFQAFNFSHFLFLSIFILKEFNNITTVQLKCNDTITIVGEVYGYNYKILDKVKYSPIVTINSLKDDP